MIAKLTFHGVYRNFERNPTGREYFCNNIHIVAGDNILVLMSAIIINEGTGLYIKRQWESMNFIYIMYVHMYLAYTFVNIITL